MQSMFRCLFTVLSEINAVFSVIADGLIFFGREIRNIESNFFRSKFDFEIEMFVLHQMRRQSHVLLLLPLLRLSHLKKSRKSENLFELILNEFPLIFYIIINKIQCNHNLKRLIWSKLWESFSWNINLVLSPFFHQNSNILNRFKFL